ncbi:sensor histidine kinase [Ferrigenium sp. UT5]|uniref:sensor histidine kinase n=1 Tax=Ferrigenium sp. UT5 TaxID=3242105 RepID=UPI003551655B
MSKKLKNLGGSNFCWTREPEFNPPGASGGVDACVEEQFQTARPSDFRKLLTSHLESAINLTQAKAGVVRVLLPDEQTLQVISAVGLTDEEAEPESLAKLACENCGKDAFRRGLCATDVEACESKQGDIANKQCHSALSIPLESTNSPGILLGVFTLFFNSPKSSSGKTASLAAIFAELCSALIEYIQANREAKRAELLQERQTIANEIHDSLAQTLNYARMSTRLLTGALRNKNELMVKKYTNELDGALEISQKAVRSLITDFRSEMDPAGLLKALHTLMAEFRSKYSITLETTIHVVDLDLPLEHEIQVYNIVREAFSNIAKHSNASHARLIIDQLCGYYVFCIEDNGVGTFSPVEGHYGITIMRERAQNIGGEIRVESTRGLGTCVQLYFPEPGSDWRKLHE